MFNWRLAHEAKSEDIRDETMLLELRRQYHCAAYNLMIAFISRTQSELKFYTSFLFEEKQSKVCFSSLKSHNFGCGWLEWWCRESSLSKASFILRARACCACNRCGTFIFFSSILSLVNTIFPFSLQSLGDCSRAVLFAFAVKNKKVTQFPIITVTL